MNDLEKAVKEAQQIQDVPKQAVFYRDKVFTKMNGLRTDIDSLEAIAPKELWPVPSYADLSTYNAIFWNTGLSLAFFPPIVLVVMSFM